MRPAVRAGNSLDGAASDEATVPVCWTTALRGKGACGRVLEDSGLEPS